MQKAEETCTQIANLLNFYEAAVFHKQLDKNVNGVLKHFSFPLCIQLKI